MGILKLIYRVYSLEPKEGPEQIAADLLCHWLPPLTYQLVSTVMVVGDAAVHASFLIPAGELHPAGLDV